MANEQNNVDIVKKVLKQIGQDEVMRRLFIKLLSEGEWVEKEKILKISK